MQCSPDPKIIFNKKTWFLALPVEAWARLLILEEKNHQPSNLSIYNTVTNLVI